MPTRKLSNHISHPLRPTKCLRTAVQPSNPCKKAVQLHLAPPPQTLNKKRSNSISTHHNPYKKSGSNSISHPLSPPTACNNPRNRSQTGPTTFSKPSFAEAASDGDAARFRTPSHSLCTSSPCSSQAVGSGGGARASMCACTRKHINPSSKINARPCGVGRGRDRCM